MSLSHFFTWHGWWLAIIGTAHFVAWNGLNLIWNVGKGHTGKNFLLSAALVALGFLFAMCREGALTRQRERADPNWNRNGTPEQEPAPPARAWMHTLAETGTFSHAAPLAKVAPAPIAPVTNMPGFVEALRVLSRHVDALLALDPYLGFAVPAARLAADIKRLTALANAHLLDGPELDLVMDFLLPRLNGVLTALPALKNAGNLPAFLESFDGLVDHVARATDSLENKIAGAAEQDAAVILRVADLTAPPAVLQPVPAGARS